MLLLKSFRVELLWANGFIGTTPETKIFVESSYNTNLKFSEISVITRGETVMASQKVFLQVLDALESLTCKWEQLKCVKLVKSPQE